MSAQLAPTPRARILDVTFDEYLADPCPVPSLNQTTARVLLTQSPLHAWAQHPRLGNEPREITTPKIEGTVIHALLLGKGASGIEVLQFDSYRTKAAQLARDAVIAQGRTPVLESKHAEIVTAAEMIRKNLAEQGCIFEGGQSEISIEWYEDADHGPVLCRGRLDYLIVEPKRAIIYDPKKIVSADARTCMRHADDFGYHTQRAAYISAVEKLYPHLAGRVEFRFAFHEIEAPNAVAVRDSSGSAQWVGERQWRRAINVWQQCLLSGSWPGYPVEPLEVTPWTLAEEEAAADRELLASSD